MLENSITVISKKYAMTVGSKAWREGIEYKTKNIASGFRASGLWHFSFPSMQIRLKLFKGVGISDS